MKNRLISPLQIILICTVLIGTVYLVAQYQSNYDKEVLRVGQRVDRINSRLSKAIFYEESQEKLESHLEDLKILSISRFNLKTINPKINYTFPKNSKESINKASCTKPSSKRITLKGGIYVGNLTFCISKAYILKTSFMSWPIIFCLIAIIAILAIATRTPVRSYESIVKSILSFSKDIGDKKDPVSVLKAMNIKDDTLKNLMLFMTQSISERIDSEKRQARYEAEKKHADAINKAVHNIEGKVNHLEKGYNLLDVEDKELNEVFKNNFSSVRGLLTSVRTGNILVRQEVEKLDIIPILKAVVKRKAELYENVEINLKSVESLKAVASEDGLDRVLSNLILNAVEATDHLKKRMIDIEVEDSADCAVIKVIDNGRGIETDDLEKIFKTGFTKGKVRGTGFGLSDVKDQINNWCGKIEVDSRKGRTEFRLSLKKNTEEYKKESEKYAKIIHDQSAHI